jgi:hypothetical protein
MRKAFKHKVIYICIALFVIILIIYLFYPGPLTYEYKRSIHHEFYFEDGYVIFRDEIKVKNHSSDNLYFYMTADVSEDMGLVTEKTAAACKKDSLEKEQFFIKARSQQSYDVYFKIPKGEKETKKDRLPPSKVIFEVVN